jgi:hypothetical protein
MMSTLIALVTLVASLFLVVSYLRSVVRDAYDSLAVSAIRAHEDGQLVPRLAFATLWAMIFALSCF